MKAPVPIPAAIRPARLSDVPALFKVRTSVKENALTLTELAEQGITPNAIGEVIAGGTCAWVAEIDAQVVGFAMVHLQAGCLFAAFVLPEQEGKGIGTRLIEAAETALFEHHAVIWLETARHSRAARIYRARGWGNEVSAGGQDVRMEKSLR